MSRTDGRSASPWRTVVAIFGAVLWLGLPIAGYWWVDAQARAASSFSAATPLATGPVTGGGGEIRTDANLTVTTSGLRTLLSPGLVGVVETVYVNTGAVLQSGDKVLRSGGLDRVAATTPIPLSAPLRENDRGPAVQALNTFLASREDGPGANVTSYNAATKAGARKFAREIGIPDADGAQFDHAWLIYLPPGAFTIATLDLQVGAPAPAAGTAIATSAPMIEKADVLSDPGGTPVAATPDQQLTVAGIEVPLNPERNAVPPESFPLLQSLMKAPDASEGVMENAEPTAAPNAAPTVTDLPVQLRAPGDPTDWRLPGAALFATEDGRTCVLPVSDGTPQAAVPVEVLAADGVEASVRGKLAEVETVALAPPADLRKCPQ